MSERTVREYREFLCNQGTVPAPGEPSGSSDGGAVSPKYSDDAVALAFAARYRDNLRFVSSWGKWLHYENGKWAKDSDKRFFDMARAACRESAEEYWLTEPKPV